MKGKLLIAMLLSFTLLGGACADPKPPVVTDSFPYYQLRSDRKTDGQYYTESGVEFPASLWQTPASERYEPLDHGDTKAYFIDSVDGTKVFCYVGIPAGASEEAPVPAVVLVHGALGTAFYDWVELWVSRGYAAIAMDTEGRMPTPETSLYHANYTEYQTSVKPHGPVNAAFTDCGKPIGEQWVYHALASVIASHSFIAGFDGVDADRIGITGVSYGGFLTCLAAGYDDRYAFAAPVYGCLSNAEGSGEFGEYIRRNRGAELWDDVGPLRACRAPVLFVNSDTDAHFTVDSLARSFSACQTGAISLIPRLTHGHSQGAEVGEVFSLAEEVCFQRSPLIRITAQPEDGVMELKLPDGASVASARLYYTIEDGLNQDTDWHRETAEYESGNVYYSREAFKIHCYLSVEDSNGRYVSSALF